VFYLSGYYLLFECAKLKYREVWVLVLFYLSFLTKISSLPLIFLTLFYYLLVDLKLRRQKNTATFEYTLDKKKIPSLMLGLLVIALLVFLTKTVYPLIFDYIFFSQLGVSVGGEGTLTGAVFDSFSPENLIIFRSASIYILMLTLFLYTLKSKPRFHSIVATASILIYVFLRVRGAGYPINFYSYHVLPLLPFLLLTLIDIKDFIKNKKIRVLYPVFLVIILLYPSVDVHGFVEKNRAGSFISTTSEVEDLAFLLEYGLHYLPPQQGRVLIDMSLDHHKKSFLKYNVPIDQDKIIAVEGGPGFGYWDWGPSILSKLNKTNRWSFGGLSLNLTLREQQLMDEIINENITLLVEAPPVWGNFRHMFYQWNTSGRRVLCKVNIPDLTYKTRSGRHFKTLYFRDFSQCTAFKREITKYYASVYDQVCSMDESSARLIKNIVFPRAKPGVLKPCDSDADLLAEHEKQSKRLKYLTNLDIYLVLLLSWLMYAPLSGSGKTSELLLKFDKK